MQIHMIGHASLFVETQDCKILMDPVLWDPHAEGIEDVCPKREIIHELIPEFDLLIISHQHLDHFDIRSLAYLPKTVDVLIPKDKLIENCLRELGYSNIYYLMDFSEVKIGSSSVIATRSENRVPEYGIVFVDDSGVFWNQVDTVVSLDTIRFVKSRFPQIDFLLATWQPMLETNYQNNQSLAFPYSQYNKILEIISLIKPKAIAPGANGFQFINGSFWLNQVVFPVTREQFCQDVNQVFPEIKDNIFAFDPGDIITIKNGEILNLKQISNFVTRLDDDRASLIFSPTNIGNSLIDDNPEHYSIDEMREMINEEICFNLPKFIMEKKDSLFLEHFHWEVIYQVEIIFSDYCSQWFFDFSQENIQVQAGRTPLANLSTIITASSFYNLLKRIKGWDYAHLGGYYRSFNKVYIATKYGIVQPQGFPIEDPLWLKFPYKEIVDSVRHQEIEKWAQPNSNISSTNQRSTSMIKIAGNYLMRLVKEPQTGASHLE